MKVTMTTSGSFRRTESFLSTMSKGQIYRELEKYAKIGVVALAAATPVESGETAAAWGYEITNTRSSYAINWTNSNAAGGLPVAIMLQYGHGTGTGGYVQGRDFINPALSGIFNQIAESVWKVVQSA